MQTPRELVRVSTPTFGTRRMRLRPGAFWELTWNSAVRWTMFGIAATSKRIEGAGAAFFDIRNGQIRRIWALGDVDGVKKQLGVSSGTWTA